MPDVLWVSSAMKLRTISRAKRSTVMVAFCFASIVFMMTASVHRGVYHNFSRISLVPDFGMYSNALSIQAQITRSIRNHTLQSICRAEEVNDLNMLDRAQRDLMARQIIVDDKRKFLYCYVPKVACSNWKRVIKFMQGTIDDIGSKMKMDHKNGLVFLDSFSEEEIRYRIRNYYKFMFVRNPMERLLSAYRNKFGEVALSQYKDRYASRIIKRYRGEWDGKSNNITLEEFI